MLFFVSTNPEIKYKFNVFLFFNLMYLLSKRYAQNAAWTHNPKIESYMSYFPSQPSALTFAFTVKYLHGYLY